MDNPLREFERVIPTKCHTVTSYFRQWPFWVLVFITLVTHTLFLQSRPIHFDESINGWFSLQMPALGFFKYDPANYHGPLYFYLLEFLTRFFGHELWVLRIWPVIFSTLSVIFLWPRSRVAAVLLALSPSAIFYGRYGIHESAFVLFQMYFFIGLYEYQKRQRLTSIYLSLFGLTGMVCLKETFLLTGFSAVVALAFFMPWKKWVADTYRNLQWPVVFSIVIVTILFTGAGQNLQGFFDFFRAFTFWFKTGVQQSGHEKPFTYWLSIMAAAEPLLLLGLGVAAVSLFFKRFCILSLFALTLFLIYSLTPYKTPWCLISFSWPIYLLMGEMLEETFRIEKKKGFILGALFLVLGLSGWLNSFGSIYAVKINLNHPFVYVNSTYEFKALNDRIEEVLAQARTKGNKDLLNQFIQISLDEPWPLPWTLQDSHGLKYDRVSALVWPQALIYFVETNESRLIAQQLDNSSGPGYVSGSIVFRQSGRSVNVYLRADVFKEFPR